MVRVLLVEVMGIVLPNVPSYIHTYSIIHYDTAQSNDKTTLKTKTYKKIFVKNEMSITELEYTCSAQDLSG